jgi:hypothetical protein
MERNWARQKIVPLDADVDEFLNSGSRGGPDLLHNAPQNMFGPYKKGTRKSNSKAKGIRGNI